MGDKNMPKFYDVVVNVLKQDSRFFTEDGEILRNAVYEATMKMDEKLLALLLSNDEIKRRFFTHVGQEAWVFDKIAFGWLVNNREFLPDSYTRFKNKIGLADHREKLISTTNDVQLVFPYKDCVLEFDSTDTEKSRKEIFYNEMLAASEIDRLLSPKVYSNCKNISGNGEKTAESFSRTDNILIKGNNLLALYSLLQVYVGRIKCMYWDILYNTDNDKVPYNDSFKHSSWLVMMKNRLEVARRLLTSDGMIFIQCDDKEMAYLKVLCDEIFDRANYVNTITIKTKIAGVSGSSAGKSLIDATEFILVYAKNKEDITIKQTSSGTPLLEVIQEYKDTNTSWKYTSVLIDKGTRKKLFEDGTKGYVYYGYENTKAVSVNQYAEMMGISEQEVYSTCYDKIFRTTNAQSSVRSTVEEKTKELDYDFVGLEYTPIKGKNAGKKIEILYKGASRGMVTFLSDMVFLDDGIPTYKNRVSTLWNDIDYNNLKKEGGVELPYGKKPEKLISRIMDICVDSGDIVLDAYLGTGTTAAVAQKRGIQYIGIEQLDEHMKIAIKRMKNVIQGDTTGISKDFNWQGGGTFTYCELAKLNQQFADKIVAAETDKQLAKAWGEMKRSGFISARINPRDINPEAKDFTELSFDEKKQLFMELLDMNQLYVNYCDIDDKEFNISEDDKAFTKSFYKE